MKKILGRVVAAWQTRLGIYFFRRRDFCRAELRFLRALFHRPTACLPHIYLYRIYLFQHRHDAALSSLRKAQSLNPRICEKENVITDRARPWVSPVTVSPSRSRPRNTLDISEGSPVAEVPSIQARTDDTSADVRPRLPFGDCQTHEEFARFQLKGPITRDEVSKIDLSDAEDHLLD